MYVPVAVTKRRALPAWKKERDRIHHCVPIFKRGRLLSIELINLVNILSVRSKVSLLPNEKKKQRATGKK
tara:strand:- start:291 stop:500 length:210 start_codon:yes stop_codon:yes gene_type:complete